MGSDGDEADGQELTDWPGLSERQKFYLRPLLPRPRKRPFLRRERKGGRPRSDDMACFEAILWKAWTDLSWRWLPDELGTSRTVLRRLSDWDRDRRLLRLFEKYAQVMTRAEAVAWKGRLQASLDRRKLLWKTDFLITLEIGWPRGR